jgi:hypothetical protein
MKIEYKWTRDDLAEKLSKKRLVPNIVFLIVGIFAYLFFTYYGFVLEEFDTKIIALGFFIYVTCILLLLFLITKLYIFMKLRRNDKKTDNAYGTYHIEVSDDKISSKINDEVITYEWEEITQFKHKKKYFFVATKEDSLGLLFCKDCLKDEKYQKLLEYVKRKVQQKNI